MKRKTWFILLIGLILTACSTEERIQSDQQPVAQTTSTTQSQGEKEDMTEEEALIALFAQVNTAMVEQDTTALEEILLDDMTLTHMTGYVQPKSEWLDDIASGSMRYYSSENEDTYDLIINGDSASLTSHDRVNASIWGSGRSTWRLKMQVEFKKIDGTWYISKQVASTY